MGARIRDGRVIGGTDFDQRPLAIDPTTLTLDPNGVVLTPELIHASLRAKAEVGAGADRYPLYQQILPLLG